MTTTHECPITGEPIQPGETISRTAARQLATTVSDLPTLMADAEYALAGLHTGTTGPSGGADGRLPINLATLEDLDVVRDSLDIWAHSLAQWANPALRYQPGNWRMVRAIIRTYADQARRWDEAPELCDEVAHCMRLLEHSASPGPTTTRIYAGKCPECGRDLLTQPDEYTVECPDDGTRVDRTEQRDAMRAEAASLYLPRPQARAAAEALTGWPIPDTTVRSWIRRSRLREYPQPAGPALVRIQDIIDLSARDTPKGA